MKAKDLLGMKFGMLKVVEFMGSDGKYRYYKCKCECGNETIVKSVYLLNGDTKSCGCLVSKILKKRNHKHGFRKEKLYGKWLSMKQRCSNPNCKFYYTYGGRGISVCKEWLDYPTFRSWALKNGYNEKLSIERIDVNGDYCPSNCCFIPYKEQAENRRNTHVVKINNKKMSLKTACKALNIPYYKTLILVNNLTLKQTRKQNEERTRN